MPTWTAFLSFLTSAPFEPLDLMWLCLLHLGIGLTTAGLVVHERPAGSRK